MSNRKTHEEYLQRSMEVSRNARAHGNTPFGAILVDENGDIVMEQENIEITEKIATGHAECTLTARASQAFDRDYLKKCTLYTIAEPCAMCAGTIYWAGIGTVAYVMSERRLLELTGSNEQNPTFDLPCREVFSKGQKDIQVLGPFPELEVEAAKIHEGYWD